MAAVLLAAAGLLLEAVGEREVLEEGEAVVVPPLCCPPIMAELALFKCDVDVDGVDWFVVFSAATICCAVAALLDVIVDVVDGAAAAAWISWW